MVDVSSAVFYIMVSLGAGFMIWVLWKTVEDEKRRQHDPHMPIRRY